MKWDEAAKALNELRDGRGWFIKERHRQAANDALGKVVNLLRQVDKAEFERNRASEVANAKVTDATKFLKEAVDKYNNLKTEYDSVRKDNSQVVTLQQRCNELEKDLVQANENAVAAWNKMCNDYEKLEQSHKEATNQIINQQEEFTKQESFIQKLGEELEQLRNKNASLENEVVKLSANLVELVGKAEDFHSTAKKMTE